jgi:hypothetical protein
VINKQGHLPGCVCPECLACDCGEVER